MNKTYVVPGGTASPMKEILVTETFLASVSKIRGTLVTADDVELNKLLHLCVDQSEAKVTEKMTDEIEVAHLGDTVELSVFFIAADRVISSGAETVVIKKYAFLLAIADDFNLDFDVKGPKNDGKSGLKKLISISKKAAAAMTVLRVVVRVAKEVFFE